MHPASRLSLHLKGSNMQIVETSPRFLDKNWLLADIGQLDAENDIMCILGKQTNRPSGAGCLSRGSMHSKSGEHAQE